MQMPFESHLDTVLLERFPMIAQIKAKIRRMLRPPLHSPQIKLNYEVLGTEYGGWPLLVDETPSGSLIYSFGIGEDISFDLAAAHKYNCTIHAFDPTPRCQAWIEQQQLPSCFHFHLMGLGSKESTLEFFAPEKDEHVSYSVHPAPGSDLNKKVLAPVNSLSKLIEKIGTPTPDILKMDIEGFEYDVIDDILATTHRPHQWLIEFHHRMYGIKEIATIQAVKKITNEGYQIFYVSNSGHEYGFVYRR